MHFSISTRWLQLHFHQIQDFLLFLVCLGHLIELDLGHFDSLFANGHQALDHIFNGPLTIFTFAIGLEQSGWSRCCMCHCK